MKLLEAEITEYTTPIQSNGEWQPITLKIKQTDKNAKIVGLQLKKQLEVYEGKGHFSRKVVINSDEWLLESSLNYKFVIDSDEWLLEGCWIQNVDYFSYKDDSHMEIKVRFDNATKK